LPHLVTSRMTSMEEEFLDLLQSSRGALDFSSKMDLFEKWRTMFVEQCERSWEWNAQIHFPAHFVSMCFKKVNVKN
jgi:hypothetical protein